MAMAAEAKHAPAEMSGEEYAGALLRAANQGRRPDLKKDVVEPYLQTPKIQLRLQKAQRALPAQSQPSCGVIPVVVGSPPPSVKVAVRRMARDPSLQLRPEAVVATVCAKYRDGSLPLPVGTKADLDRACKNVK